VITVHPITAPGNRAMPRRRHGTRRTAPPAAITGTE
jgi:hypothetical protein